MKEADNFKEFIENNFSESNGRVDWNWIEGYKLKLTDKFKKKLLKIMRGFGNDRV